MDKEREPVKVPPTVEGDRIVVRRYDPHDGPALWAAVQESRPHISPWQHWIDAIQALEDAAGFVARARAKWSRREEFGYGFFAVQSGELLGGVGFYRIDWDRRIFGLRYWIRAGAVGRGYATEAVRLLTDVAFVRLGANRVDMRIDSRNERSRRLAERLEFIKEATVRSGEPNGTFADRLVFALTRDQHRRLGWVTTPPSYPG